MVNDKNGIFWQNWLLKYKTYKCLWDPSDKTTQEERLVAWSNLIEMAKTVNNNANANFVRAFLEKYIHKYKLETRKVEAAKANGILYEPTKFYYKIFKSIYKARQAGVEFKGPKASLPNLSQEKLIWYSVLKKYVTFKCLWDHQKTYEPKERLKAWCLLLKMLKQNGQTDADIKFIKKRVSTYRANYLREMNKIKRMNEQGVEYKSQLFYMNILAPIYQTDCELIDDSSDEMLSSNESSVEDDMLAEISGNDQNKNKRNLAKCTKDNDLWRKVLKKYVAYDCLWDNRYVYKRTERTEAWQELIKYVQNFYPAAHLDYLRSRIATLRNHFEKEREKILNAQKNGIELKPEIFYYDIIRPVYDFEDDVKIEYQSEESTNDSKSNCSEASTERNKIKYSALREELESLGFICGSFETENLSQEQKAWLLIIKKYVTLKCLWGVRREDYTTIERDVAWHELLGMVKETINSEMDLAQMKLRINTFRANYLRNYRKAKEEREQGLEPIVTLWYFNAISPIYQEGFPIILNPDEDLQPEETLNPVNTTYFPDDENDVKQKIKDEVEIRDEVVDKMSPTNDSETKTEIELAEEFLYVPDSTFTTQHSQLSDDEEYCESQSEHFNQVLENQLEIRIEEKSARKRKHFQKYEDVACENLKNCETPKLNKFQTFETKIADHLSGMKWEQYLLAEKLISDVCVYGRLGKLTIETGFKLKT